MRLEEISGPGNEETRNSEGEIEHRQRKVKEDELESEDYAKRIKRK